MKRERLIQALILLVLLGVCAAVVVINEKPAAPSKSVQPSSNSYNIRIP